MLSYNLHSILTIKFYTSLCFFLNDTATTEIYTILFVGSVRCVQETATAFNMKLINSCLEEQIDLEAIQQEFKKGSHRQIIDFDNHFEDSSLDFTNPQLKL
eukprot:TRINITY_DN2044_c0_g1_i1.p3 TRINITY_DN2044_c0_g1~~TRINITY_DN2044_c0_g1_i1.p3  ORF type:complete len:101 (-),score=15.57 TRINITY_DN2044_c0_g1_i1:124-426(-)